MNPSAPAASLVGHYRWRILAFLFAATTINYMDRSVLGVLAPTLQYRVFHWTDEDYAYINIAFKAAYAIGLVSMGALIDRIGTRAGYALSIGVWSVFGLLHALVRPAFGLLGFSIARFGLGLGESGNFPAAIKTTGEWFPRRERAFATGIFNAGSNFGAILAPLLIPLVVLPDGTHWQFAFICSGVFSALWLILWLRTYRPPAENSRVSKQELSYILSDSPTGSSAVRVPWVKVLPLRETWAFSLAKITDLVWWFYLFWGGKYLFDRFGLDIKGVALPLIIIYGVSDMGSVSGGWLSSTLIKRGWTVNRSRKTALLISALCVTPVVFVTRISTRFNVNDAFFAKVAESRLEPMAVLDQETGAAGALSKVPTASLVGLRALQGRSFGSAREFTSAVEKVIPLAIERRFENVLIQSARTDRYYWLAVVLIAFAAAGHQAWSTNLYTLVSDVFPKQATASVVGIGGMVGAVAGIVGDWSLGRVLSSSGPDGYLFAFLIAGSAYLFFLGVVQLLMPRMTPLDDSLRHTLSHES